MKKMKKTIVLILALVAMMSTSCTKPVGYGNIDIQISHTVNGNPLTIDSLCYVNEAGEQFLITEIQWFISRITLMDDQGNVYLLGHREMGTSFETPQEKIFYIDTNIPESLTLETAPLPSGHYTSLSFTFGLNQEDNQTGLFSDPPERDMFWPEPLGGGYHYMKLNGKYLDQNGMLHPMNIHLGIGQNEDHTEFFQNYFTVELPLDLDLEADATNVIHLDMNIDNWFRNPHTYSITAFGSAIMQNQEAQRILKENGHDVFSIATDNTMESPLKTTAELLRKAAPKPHFMTWENLKNTFSNIKERL